jgi:hypothetical protein
MSTSNIPYKIPALFDGNEDDDLAIHFGKGLHPLFVQLLIDLITPVLLSRENDVFVTTEGLDYVTHTPTTLLYQGSDWNEVVEKIQLHAKSYPDCLRNVNDPSSKLEDIKKWTDFRFKEFRSADFISAQIQNGETA